MYKPFTILVEGNIGSGKTTLIDSLKNIPNLELLTERIADWKNVGGHNLFNLVYTGGLKYHYLFQMTVLRSQLMDKLARTDKKIRIFERSPYSSFHVFIEGVKHKIQDVEYKSLEKWFNFATVPEGLNFKPDLIVYLQTTPEIAYRRLSNRERPEEARITFEYIKKIHELHENWLIQGKKPIPAPVLVITQDCLPNSFALSTMTTPIKAKQGKASKKAEPKYVNKNVGLITLVELLNNHANPIPPETPKVEDSGTINNESQKDNDSQPIENIESQKVKDSDPIENIESPQVIDSEPINIESQKVKDSENHESLKVEDSQLEEMEISLPDQLALKPGPDRQTLMWAPCRHH